MKKLKEAYESLDLVQFELEIESDMDTLVYIVVQVSGL